MILSRSAKLWYNYDVIAGLQASSTRPRRRWRGYKYQQKDPCKSQGQRRHALKDSANPSGLLQGNNMKDLASSFSRLHSNEVMAYRFSVLILTSAKQQRYGLKSSF
ncbi:hypothetical protein PoB_006248700 [Plakobranchus ocellatus]|uniref:Uncharacterized protein n=1 Tax=Plakobranchus ocellatus TaxID=259542 RepID=A0AAV4CVP9_9GAST|nr:hypothetical protein PoB_006248700 [Plakobranchus ocellatus]